jgi:hypothetical protein
MKTTLEIPDFLFRSAKSAAAQRGIPLGQFVTEAVLAPGQLVIASCGVDLL